MGGGGGGVKGVLSKCYNLVEITTGSHRGKKIDYICTKTRAKSIKRLCFSKDLKI